MKTDVTVIGPGNWGRSLIAALRSAGIPVSEVITRTRRSGTTTIAAAQLNARILWLCVPDGAIAEVAAALVQRRREQGNTLRGQVVVHSSGALTVAPLNAARKIDAAVASVHPVMSFPTQRIVPLWNVLFGVEAQQPEVKRRLYAVIRKIGGKLFAIRSAKKVFYHAAGTMASPLLVSELSAAMATARMAGLSASEARKCVEVLAKATVQNVFAHGEQNSFSGPFARGDVATISLHLQALAKHPIVEVYRSLAQYAVQALPVKRKGEIQFLLENETGMKTTGRETLGNSRSRKQ
ncbi:DUF2520 domain-containing protein [Alloacidobacterium dinghuense]|uniref:DUF2520 domain-containing protein n=1 Tax=Alloacidobacterium dinghuense TaxID=2763107 RepID=A0A7G8BLA6_9BACT|nr:DUF2520 domain-containing protein [Alloacidobacterium dinghuense]QNI33326.1 DUF2520 domain-containing protein [Alloacidobacterium dinghuense]